jgi:hypothetical protein
MSVVEIQLVLIRAVVVELVPDARSTEFSCFPLLDGIWPLGIKARLAVFGWRTGSITIRNALAHHFVPLLLCFAVEKGNHDHGHVVAAHASSLAVGCEAVVHHVLTDGVQFLLGGNSSPHELDHGL